MRSPTSSLALMFRCTPFTRSSRLAAVIVLLALAPGAAAQSGRQMLDFTEGWRFHLGDVPGAEAPAFDDGGWRRLDLPHDWSIEGAFSPDHPATPGGGALPGGVGWYRKAFAAAPGQGQLAFVEFDGVYRHSEVWLNGHALGKRPNGYVSFRYELTPYLRTDAPNVLAVRVDNSAQPNSRWYSGSGIYRNVRLVFTPRVHVDQWGVFVTTPEVSDRAARVRVRTAVRNAAGGARAVALHTALLDPDGKEVAAADATGAVAADSVFTFDQELSVPAPARWSVERPVRYRVVSRLAGGDGAEDVVETPFGIRTFAFDAAKGFSLNGVAMKLKGVCNHHDLGALGAAVHVRALERQLELLKAMGVNAIRTSHNPPAPELLDLADRMGFLVMDEAFDMWRQAKTRYDYSLDWDAWHVRDLEDFVRRDRNHPSVILWSIGNEIPEQSDSTGAPIARALAAIVRRLDGTRPITAGMNDARPENSIARSGALDVVGFNYNLDRYTRVPRDFPGVPFVATETTSALATRGAYDLPADSVRVWPVRWDLPFDGGNPDYSCSAYDNCHVPWGSTHEAAWRLVKRHDYLSGLFIWTGFDYLGEPTPYPWPARSSYFGILDLAGFPKDAYYFYQSEWTDTPVLHLFPHWNWAVGDTVDVWAYTNAEAVELFLDGRSLGVREKRGDTLHVAWRVPFAPGVLRAVGRTGGREVAADEVRTAGAPARLVLQADRAAIAADGRDLAFVTVQVVDAAGIPVPHAANLLRFRLDGAATLAAVDNGSQTSHEPFQASERRAFHGRALVVVRAAKQPGTVTLTAMADGLAPASLPITLR